MARRNSTAVLLQPLDALGGSGQRSLGCHQHAVHIEQDVPLPCIMLPPAHSPSHRDGASRGPERGPQYDRANVSAQLDIVAVGYADDRVASTVVLVRDADAIIVIDPGMAASRDVILGPLEALGVSPPAVSDVIFSHHHPDHTLNAALFPDARFHDHWAIYQGDVWTDRPAEGYAGVALGAAAGDPRAHAGGHHHIGADRRRPGRLHAPVVVGGRVPKRIPWPPTRRSCSGRAPGCSGARRRSHRSGARPSLRAAARRLSRAGRTGRQRGRPGPWAPVGPIRGPWPPARRSPARRHAAIAA